VESDAHHVSSPNNIRFRSFGGFSALNLDPFDLAKSSVAKDYFQDNPLPPLVPAIYCAIRNEAEASAAYYREVVYRVESILNLLFPYLNLHARYQYSNFPRDDAEGSIDVLWRVRDDKGEDWHIALVELKRPGGLKVEQWKNAFGRRRTLPPDSRTFDDSLQLSKYSYGTGIRHIMFTDLLASVAIKLEEDTLNLKKTATTDIDIPAPAWINICERHANGDSLVRQVLAFVTMALNEMAVIKL
jgi:hypothetical protein